MQELMHLRQLKVYLNVGRFLSHVSVPPKGSIPHNRGREPMLMADCHAGSAFPDFKADWQRSG